MITIEQGINRIVVPKLDMPNPMPAVIMLRLHNDATGRQAWCEVVDDGLLSDWYQFVFEVVGANADPLQSQISMTTKDKGMWVATLYGNSVYSESPTLNTELRKEKCAYL